MDQNRIIQLLQEVISNQNSTVYKINDYITEIQNNSWSYIEPSVHQNVINEKDMAWSRVNDLQNQLTSLQQNFDILSTNTSGSSAEIQALRSLVDAITSERDFLQTENARKDGDIANLNQSIEDIKNTQINSLLATNSDLNNAVFSSNETINNLNLSLEEKQRELTECQAKLADIGSKLRDLRLRVKAELEEATGEVDEVFNSESF